jgi:hypothetical protein
LHTWGGDLSYHPHVHVLITNGGLDENSNWHENSLAINSIRTYYTKIIRKKMLKALTKNELCLPPGIDSDELAKIIKIKYFNIQQFGTYESGKGVLQYLSNKLKVGALNHRQVTAYDAKTVTFNYKRGEKTETIKLSREEFIRRYLNHIPPKGFMMVRSCGIYSARNKAKILELKEKLFGLIEEEPEDTSPHFKCPICGKELSIVVRYNSKEFKRSKELKKIGYPERPPPKHMEFVKF